MQKSISNPLPEQDRLSARIRRGSAKDIAAMRAVACNSNGASQWSAEIYERVFSSEAPPRLTWVVEPCAFGPGMQAGSAGVGLLGFLVALGSGAEWELENLAVVQPCRRRGLGRRLVRALVTQACKAGAESIFLEVRESNLAARVFYESAGFRTAGRRPEYYSDPPEDAIVYRRELFLAAPGNVVASPEMGTR